MVLEGAMRIMEKITVDPMTGEWYDDEEPDEETPHDHWADAEDKFLMNKGRNNDEPAGVPGDEDEQVLREAIKGMIRESLEEMGFNNFGLAGGDFQEKKHIGTKSRHAQANQHYKTNPKTNRQARETKRAVVLKWLRDPSQAVNCAEIMRQLWNPSPQDEDTKRGEFYKKRDGAINKQSGARYSFTDEEINQLYRIKSNRS